MVFVEDEGQEVDFFECVLDEGGCDCVSGQDDEGDWFVL